VQHHRLVGHDIKYLFAPVPQPSSGLRHSSFPAPSPTLQLQCEGMADAVPWDEGGLVPHKICTSDAGSCYFWPAIPCPTHLLGPRRGSNRSGLTVFGQPRKCCSAAGSGTGNLRRVASSPDAFGPVGRRLASLFASRATGRASVAPLSGVCAYRASPPKSHPSKLTATLDIGNPRPRIRFLCEERIPRDKDDRVALVCYSTIMTKYPSSLAWCSAASAHQMPQAQDLTSGSAKGSNVNGVTLNLVTRHTPALPGARATEHQPTGRSSGSLSAKVFRQPCLNQQAASRTRPSHASRHVDGENGEAKSQSGIARKASQRWTRGVGLCPKAQPNCSTTDMQVACGLLPRARGRDTILDVMLACRWPARIPRCLPHLEVCGAGN
jgi:hypothetical protein